MCHQVAWQTHWPKLLQGLPAGTCNLNRHNLVIASATDSSQLSGWLDGFESANWDLAVIIGGFQGFECAQCVHLEQAQGSKWQKVLQFLTKPAFEQCYGPHYKQVSHTDILLVSMSSHVGQRLKNGSFLSRTSALCNAAGVHSR